jgi:hypothetical protein
MDMRLRALALLAAVVAALAVVGSAFAFDCIRVSSSLQGLQQSTNGGHWLVFDMTSPAALLESIGPPATLEQATCVSEAYQETGLPVYFALGIGVAGGFHAGSGVLAHNNPNDNVLGNLKGVDHLEDSPIGAALFAAAAECGVPTDS